MRKKLTLTAAILAVGRDRGLRPATRDEYRSRERTSRDCRSWVYVGSPLTPDGLNGNKEGFPEYHAAGPQATAIPRWFAR
jgi:hypothetical protein